MMSVVTVVHLIQGNGTFPLNVICENHSEDSHKFQCLKL